MTGTLTKVEEIVRNELDNDSIKLTLGTKASEVEGWDSLAHVRIVVAVEGAFGLRFDTGKITALKNVGELVALVEQGLK